VVERTPPVQPRPRPEPAVTISTRVVTPPKYREWIERVPVLRTFQRNRYKAGEAFVPPRAAYQTTPRIPPRLARELQGEWRIEMRLTIAPDGLVRRVELLSPGAEPHLADIAADAMGRWRFDPATLRGKPVSSEVVATLHYRNAVPENALAQRRQ